MFDWLCTNPACGIRFDDLAHSTDETIECRKCYHPARRLISPVRFPVRMGVDPDMPTMASKWAKMHKQGRDIDAARERENGPDSWGADGGDVRR